MASPLDPAAPLVQHAPRASSGNGLLYAAIGCAGFLVVALCVATGLGVWWYTQKQEELATAPPVLPIPDKPLPPDPANPWNGTNSPLPPPPTTAPRSVAATVTEVTGASPVPVGANCAFNVETDANPAAPNGYWCRTQIVCGGRLLYGGPNAGFFPCTMTESPPTIVGRDDDTTNTDSDAAMELDTGQSRLTVRDDASSANGAYSIVARIDTIL